MTSPIGTSPPGGGSPPRRPVVPSAADIRMVLLKLGGPVLEGLTEVESLRRRLDPIKVTPYFLNELGLRRSLQQQFMHFLNGGAMPTASLLNALIGNKKKIRQFLSAPALSPAFRALLYQSGLPGRSSPKGGVGVVILDADKTFIEGESANHLIRHGLVMHPLKTLSMPNALTRVWKALRMMSQYERGVLSPESAQDSVASLLDGVPVLASAKTWVDSGARTTLKREVLRDARREAREIVRQEWEAKIAAGEMVGPINEDLLHEESLRRIYVVSSQTTQVIRMLTAAGPDREDLLGGIRPENIVGSDAEFDEEGRIKPGTFDYCFGEKKYMKLESLFRERGVVINRGTTRVYSDNPHYDGPLFEFAKDPGNRIIVDSSGRNLAIARIWGARVLYDSWDEVSSGRYVSRRPLEKAAGSDGLQEAEDPASTPRSLRVGLDWRIFPDTRRPALADAVTRSVFGMLEMSPALVMELQHYANDRGPASINHWGAAVMAAGIGALYGPLNRGKMGHLVTGALCAGGMAFFHGSGHLAASMAAGAATLTGLHYLWNRAIFMPGARQLPPAYAGAGRQTWNFTLRIGLTTLWSAGMHFGMRLFGLG